MHFLGFAGMPRRIADYPSAYQEWNLVASVGTLITIVSMLFFFVSISLGLVNYIQVRSFASYTLFSPTMLRLAGQ